MRVRELIVYQADDATELVTFSTDAAAAQPYLDWTDRADESSVDVVSGSVSIAEYVVELLDARVTPADQASGYVTSILADAAGRTQLIGHRVTYREQDGIGGWVILLDGIILDLALLDDLVSYSFQLADIRERERGIRAIENTDTALFLPRGVLDGYGLAPGGEYLIPPPTEFPTGTVIASSSVVGEQRTVELISVTAEIAPMLLAVTPAMLRAAAADPDTSGNNTRLRAFWRLAGGGGVFNAAGVLLTPLTRRVRLGTAEGPEGLAVWRVVLHDALGVGGLTVPALNDDVELYLRYEGETSETFPWHFEGTAGELIQALYDGDLSSTPTNIRYDSVALLAMTDRVRLRVTEPIEDLRAWLEDNVYGPLGWAPVRDELGRISPIFLGLPSTAPAVTITAADVVFDDRAGWRHAGATAVNRVVFRYLRDYAQDPDDSSADPTEYSADRLAEREVVHEFVADLSGSLLGDQDHEFESEALRAIGDHDGRPITGDVRDEPGFQVARRRAFEINDRLEFGGQESDLLLHVSANTSALRIGDWITAAVPWLPDYSTGVRGGARIAQIVSLRRIDPVTLGVRLLDGGPDLQALAGVVVGVLSVDADGVVTVPLTSVPAGADARVDYAVTSLGGLRPADTASEWTFAGRRTGIGDVTTPALPAGVTVHIRARAEAGGRIRSAWISGGQVDTPDTPRIVSASVVIDVLTGDATVRWSSSAQTVGVRIHYGAHDPDVQPTLASSVDTANSNGSLGVVIAAGALPGEVVTVEVEPWTGFTGGVVSGTAGERLRAVSKVFPLDTRNAGNWIEASPLYWKPALGSTTAEVIARFAVRYGADVLSVRVEYDLNGLPISYVEPITGGVSVFALEDGGGTAVALDDADTLGDITLTPFAGAGATGTAGSPFVLAAEQPASAPIIDAIPPDTNITHPTPIPISGVTLRPPANPANPPFLFPGTPVGDGPRLVSAVDSDASTGREGVGVDARNLIKNGGGQSDAIGAVASGWTNFQGVDLLVTQIAKIGDRALRLTHLVATDSISFQTLAAAVGDYWLISGWLRTDANTGTGDGAFIDFGGSGSPTSQAELVQASAPLQHGTTGADLGVGVGASAPYTFVWMIIRITSAGALGQFTVNLRLGRNGTIIGTTYMDGISAVKINDLDRLYETIAAAKALVPGTVVQQPTVTAKNLAYGLKYASGYDGDTISFDPPFEVNPILLFGMGGIVFDPARNGGGASAVMQVPLITAEGLTPTGFTLRAKLREAVAAPTARQATFVGTDANKGFGPEAVADQYTFVFDVTVNQPLGPTFFSSIKLGFWANDGGGWDLVTTRTYAESGDGSTGYTLIDEEVPITWDGMILNTDFRITIELEEGSGGDVVRDLVKWNEQGAIAETAMTAANGAVPIPVLALAGQ